MDKLPKTTFIWSPDTEIERVAYTLAVIAEGFYARKGFVVLEHPLKEDPQASVVLPRLVYGLEAQTWKTLASLPRDFPFIVPPSERAKLANILHNELNVDPSLLAQYEKLWKGIEQDFWSVIREYFPEELGRIGSLEVRLTRWGTTGSFSTLSNKKGQRLVVYIRVDTNKVQLGSLAGVIMLALVRYMEQSHGYTWTRRETIMDFLMSRSVLRKLFPDFRPMLFGLRRIPQAVREASAAYVLELGIPMTRHEVEVVGEMVVVRGQLMHNIGRQEVVLIKELGAHRGEVVSFDRLADLLWGEGEFKTYWAINKLVQRLRKKLVALGIPASSLQTLRGRGYTLI